MEKKLKSMIKFKGKVGIVVGLQYGDEGKAKIVDFLAPQYDIGARFNGSSNAGHTVILNDRTKIVLHMLPATSIKNQGPKEKKKKISYAAVLACGTIVDLKALEKDIETTGIDPKKVIVDRGCPVITDEDREIDRQTGGAVGTTGKGVGPCMERQIKRVGDRVGDIKKDIEKSAISGVRIGDTREYLLQSIRDGKSVLFEGAQAIGLDIWHGTYPYVTTSCCSTGAVSTNAGIPWNMIDEVWGVFKAYTTRVGNGPMKPEMPWDTEEFVRKMGNEFGSTTGRPRRCAWLNIDDIKRGIEINGTTHLCMTKSDVLRGLEKVVVTMEGREETFAGFQEVDEEEDKSFMLFVGGIEEMLGKKIDMIGIGPRRKDIKVR
jgi:adenylosuccinate synthase